MAKTPHAPHAPGSFTGPTPPARRQPQDATLRNVRAAHRREASVAAAVEAVEARLVAVEQRLAVVEQQMTEAQRRIGPP